MEYLITSFLVVFPIFLKLLLGYGIRHMNIMSDMAFKQMNNVTFRVFLPLLLFMNIYTADLESSISLRLIGFAITALLVLFALAMLIVPRFEPTNRKRGVIIQAICRSNFIIFGLPVATTLYGTESAGTASVLVGVIVPFINTLAVITLEYFRGSKPSPWKIFKGVVANPIIIGAAAALVMVLANFTLPAIIDAFFREMAVIATPLALIILGGSVTFTTVKENRKQLIGGIITRLVLVPLVGLTAAVLLGFRNAELVILMAMFSSPAAVSSYTMALQMEGDGDLAGQLVVFTTVFSIVTIFFWVYMLMFLNFI
ncbi:MAG TPA: AEC family transporter [Sphaerochaetaceae bacterium]|nr:AEC family transporter [Sphaerochaetaceae bacterium]